MVTNKHYVNNFNISETLKDLSNTLQNYKFMGTTVFEIAGGLFDPSLVKGVGAIRLGKGRAKVVVILKL